MTKYVVISPCRASAGGAALARGEYFPPSADEVQIERLQKANCLAPESSPEGKRARSEYLQLEAGQRQASEAAERQRAEAARMDTERAQRISDEIAAAEKRRDEALATADEAEAKHAERLQQIAADLAQAEKAHADRLAQLGGDIASQEERLTSVMLQVTESEKKLQGLAEQVAAADAELAKKPGKKG
ncbi:hypothetical protein IED13_15440 [Bosea sp. SSUT16]|uniref:Uncharacterized protein n=1 Tax=Bosea spartocytisi TaxID=2773451 RepID=A0A927EAV3_9HYPH|nr:hypothetical protein [Bosea spartocytisi]MBD3847102.1 hypothetical protein [Bosea spartocytisi]MCT4474202.1 hypothetical protein [Bosea spartocytisi]